jgi:hypothetical protein
LLAISETVEHDINLILVFFWTDFLSFLMKLFISKFLVFRSQHIHFKVPDFIHRNNLHIYIGISRKNVFLNGVK